MTAAANFIKDEVRQAYINAIYNRIRVGKSVLLVGKCGSGKSTLIESIKPKRRRVITVDSLAPLHYMMGSVLNQMDYDINLKNAGNTMQHLEMICQLKGLVILVDEANDLRPPVWAYLKRIMNAGIPIILSGLPKTKVHLEREHEDILSRLKVLNLSPIRLEDYKKALASAFDSDAVDIIFGAAGENMRVFDEICDDCIDKITELKLPKVTAEIAARFV